MMCLPTRIADRAILDLVRATGLVNPFIALV